MAEIPGAASEQTVDDPAAFAAAANASTDLDHATRKDANLKDANLKDANLKDANLKDSNLGDSNLKDSNLKDSNLGEVLAAVLKERGGEGRGG